MQANFPEDVVQNIPLVAAVAEPAAVLEEFVGFGAPKWSKKREK